MAPAKWRKMAGNQAINLSCFDCFGETSNKNKQAKRCKTLTEEDGLPFGDEKELIETDESRDVSRWEGEDVTPDDFERGTGLE